MIEIGKLALGKMYNTRSLGLIKTYNRHGQRIVAKFLLTDKYVDYYENGMAEDDRYGIEADVMSEINPKDNPEYYL